MKRIKLPKNWSLWLVAALTGAKSFIHFDRQEYASSILSIFVTILLLFIIELLNQRDLYAKKCDYLLKLYHDFIAAVAKDREGRENRKI